MKQNLLEGHMGTDPHFTETTHAGVARSHVKHSDDQLKLELTADEHAIFNGEKGELLQRAMKTVVAYGTHCAQGNTVRQPHRLTSRLRSADG
jgi:hypothetical protein